MKNKVKTISRWTSAIWCFLFALVNGVSISGILLALLGVMLLPISPVQSLWQKMLPDKFKWLKRTIVLGIFIVAVAISPTVDTSTQTEKDSQAVSQQEVDEQLAEEESIEEQQAEEQPADEKEIEQQEVKEEPTTEFNTASTTTQSSLPQVKVELPGIASYTGATYSELNGNVPTFAELSTESFEIYAELDSIGRCGVAYACVGQDIMPTEERGTIGQVKPTGWHTIKYDIVDGKYLYNRCHLIGYQLAGENANTKNLITGTRYLNMEGMLPFENTVAEYVEKTGNHVMYRVTPHFENDNQLASGVQMEAYSVEDEGKGVCFNVYVYNVQPGIVIDYATGDSRLEETPVEDVPAPIENTDTNQKTSETQGAETKDDDNSNEQENTQETGMVWKSATGKKYHSVNDCGNMDPNKAVQITKQQAIEDGLGECSICH